MYTQRARVVVAASHDDVAAILYRRRVPAGLSFHSSKAEALIFQSFDDVYITFL